MVCVRAGYFIVIVCIREATSDILVISMPQKRFIYEKSTGAVVIRFLLHCPFRNATKLNENNLSQYNKSDAYAYKSTSVFFVQTSIFR